MRQQVERSGELSGVNVPRASLASKNRLLRLVARKDVTDRQCELVRGRLPLVRVGLICPQLSVAAHELPEQRA